MSGIDFQYREIGAGVTQTMVAGSVVPPGSNGDRGGAGDHVIVGQD